MTHRWVKLALWLVAIVTSLIAQRMASPSITQRPGGVKKNSPALVQRQRSEPFILNGRTSRVLPQPRVQLNQNDKVMAKAPEAPPLPEPEPQSNSKRANNASTRAGDAPAEQAKASDGTHEDSPVDPLPLPPTNSENEKWKTSGDILYGATFELSDEAPYSIKASESYQFVQPESQPEWTIIGYCVQKLDIQPGDTAATACPFQASTRDEVFLNYETQISQTRSSNYLFEDFTFTDQPV